MMNPIENVWSKVNAHVKQSLREGLAAFLGPPPENMTREEFRMQYLEDVAVRAIERVDPRRMHAYTAHLEGHYERALNREDLLVGT